MEGSYKSIWGKRAQVGRTNSPGSSKTDGDTVIHKSDILNNRVNWNFAGFWLSWGQLNHLMKAETEINISTSVKKAIVELVQQTTFLIAASLSPEGF